MGPAGDPQICGFAQVGVGRERAEGWQTGNSQARDGGSTDRGLALWNLGGSG